MAIKKKPVKAAKKVQPKKTAKPAAKKVVAKKPGPAKPVKKDSPKKHIPVVKKPAASVSKSVPFKNSGSGQKNSYRSTAAKKPAP